MKDDGYDYRAAFLAFLDLIPSTETLVSIACETGSTPTKLGIVDWRAETFTLNGTGGRGLVYRNWRLLSEASGGFRAEVVGESWDGPVIEN